MKKIKFIDLFCGIGGFHYAIEDAAHRLGLEAECVFASDIDKDASKAYKENFGIDSHSDITKVDASDIPSHDILLGGFPCQAFSIIGARKGFDDTRGTLFFDIARILKEKQPKGFVLENVKQLKGHDGGRTLIVILDTLRDLGYEVDYKVLNAKDFGLPQKRERIFIVGWRKNLNFDWDFEAIDMKPLSKVLEKNVDSFYFASKKIADSRKLNVKAEQINHKRPTIWHENKSGNISAYEYSCALRAGASYNYLLVNGERRMTEREMLRLQGFPEHFNITHPYATMRRFAGNSLPIPAANAVIFELIDKNIRINNEPKSSKVKTSNKVSTTLSVKQFSKSVRKKVS
jgi:DNA (cytosine-5)-methyltransferase 1